MPQRAPAPCNKKPFECRRHARAEARRMRKSKGQKYHAYRCPTCGLYHVGRPHIGTTTIINTRLARRALKRAGLL